MSYDKTKSRATMRGEWYEVKIATLIHLRLKNSSDVDQFRLATNVAGTGALDDVVFTYSTRAHPAHFKNTCIQLKHREKGPLTLAALESPTGNISLKVYVNSIFDIKKAMDSGNWKNKILFMGPFESTNFVLYTNSRAEKALKGSKQITNSSSSDSHEWNFEELIKTGSEEEFNFKFSNAGDESVLLSLVDAYTEDPSLFKTTMEMMSVFSGQANESQLDDMIKKELRLFYKNDVTDIDLMYIICEKHFKKWWLESDLYLNEKSDILDGVLRQYRKHNTLLKEVVNCTLDIDYNEDVLNNIEEFSDNSPLTSVVTDNGSIRASATKVLRRLQIDHKSFTLISLKFLLSDRGILICDWENGEEDFLVIVVVSSLGVDSTDMEYVCMKLSKVLDVNPKKRLVVVSKENDSFAMNLKMKCMENICVKDTFDFMDLNQESKERVLNTKVSFQENVVPLKDLLGTQLKCLSSDGFIEALLSKDVVEIGEKIPDMIFEFIPRRLKTCPCLRLDVLNCEGLTDVFAVSGLSLEELREMVSIGTKVKEAENCTGSETRYWLLNPLKAKALEEFDNLCKKFSQVHWLHMESGKLVWRKTHGNITVVNQYISHDEIVVDSDHVLSSTNRAVIIVGEPGMGKSTLMPSLAKVFKETTLTDWVISINLRERIELLNRPTPISALEFLLSATRTQSPWEQSLLEASLQHTGNVVVLLDGFDEICPRFEQEGCALLTTILKTKVKKVVVTTRHFMTDKLRTHCSTLTFGIVEFSEDDQISFLEKCWSRSAIERKDRDIKKCITNLMKSLRLINKKRNSILGIPLQTKMLAEIFQDRLEEMTENFSYLFDAFSLLEQFVETKFNIFYKKCATLTKKDLILQKFSKVHMHAAVLSLYPSEVITKLNIKHNIAAIAQKLTKNFVDGVGNSGIIIDVKNNRPTFIHQLFAEYFASLWFTNNIESNTNFLQENIFEGSFSTIRELFDRSLARDHDLHTAVLNNDITQVEELLSTGIDVDSVDRGGRTAIHLASAHGFGSHISDSYIPSKKKTTFFGPQPTNIVRVLQDHGAKCNIIDKVLHFTPLQYAMKSRTWYAMEDLLTDEACRNTLTIPKELARDIFLWKGFIKYGLVNCFALMIDRFEGAANREMPGKESLLHEACQYGHLSIVNVLLDKRANIYLQNRQGETPIDIARSCGHETIVNRLLEHANMETREVIFSSSLSNFEFKLDCKDGKNWLHQISSWGSLSVVQAHIENLGDKRDFVTKYINTQDNGGDTALFIASRRGHSDIVKFLITHGGDLQATNKKGRNCLHEVSACGSLSVVQALIESLGDDRDSVREYINTQDNDGDTAMLIASGRGHSEAVEYLIEHGGEIKVTNKKGRNCLHLVSDSGDLSVVQVLIESLGGNRDSMSEYINTQDSSGDTAMLIAFRRDHSRIVEFLIRHGGNIQFIIEDGKKCLHEVSDWGHLSVVQAYIDSLGENRDAVRENINTKDSFRFGDTAMIVAARCGHSDIVKLLIKQGGDVRVTNEIGRNCLHAASGWGHLSVVQTVIDSLGENRDLISEYINTQDAAGDTAMIVASKCGHSDIVELLIKRGGDIRVTNEYGRNCLLEVSGWGHLSVVQTVIDSLGENRDFVSEYINTQDSSGDTALIIACRCGHLGIVVFLIEHGGDIRSTNDDGSTCLHEISDCDSLSKFQAPGENLRDQQDSDIEYSYKSYKSESFRRNRKFFTRRGADRKSKFLSKQRRYTQDPDKKSSSYLHHEVSDHNRLSVIQALIESLGDNRDSVSEYINTQDSSGDTAMIIASRHGHSEIVEFLMRHSGDM